MWGRQARGPERHELVFEAYGVGIGLTCQPSSLLEEVQTILPPGRRPSSESGVQVRFMLVQGADGRYGVLSAGNPIVQGVEARMALGVLDGQIRAAIATRTTEWVFIHAGVVEHRGEAIVIPGSSFSGKTTLVRALIERGASYFSDEYAVLDFDGWVHPYPRPLSIRTGASRADTIEIPPGELGAVIGDRRARTGVVVLTSYRPEASWAPTTGTVADAALALIEHAVLARDQPQRVLSVVSKAVSGARLLEGERGEATVTAGMLLGAVVG